MPYPVVRTANLTLRTASLPPVDFVNYPERLFSTSGKGQVKLAPAFRRATLPVDLSRMKGVERALQVLPIRIRLKPTRKQGSALTLEKAQYIRTRPQIQ